MKTFRASAIAALCMLIAGLPCATSAAPAPAKGGTVWVWSSQCSPAKTMSVEISLDSTTLYKSSFAICQMQPGDVHPWSTQSGVAFSLKSTGRSILGEPATEGLDGNLWDAGDETNSLIFGVSFATGKHVWLNALHVVYPDKPSRSELGSGLAITTHPINDATQSTGTDLKPVPKQH